MDSCVLTQVRKSLKIASSGLKSSVGLLKFRSLFSELASPTEPFSWSYESLNQLKHIHVQCDSFERTMKSEFHEIVEQSDQRN